MIPLNHIRVLGNSGFSVEVVNESTVRKAAAPGAGAERLRRQINKQKDFLLDSRRGRIRMPAILKQTDGADSFSAEMEFIAAKDFVQFLTEADRAELDDFVKLVADFINDNLARSVDQDVAGLVAAKARELGGRGVAPKYVEAVLAWSAGLVKVPVGPCHGDLTLSNILFKGKNLYLIDFLDPFVESPIQDVVKLRQDTCFGWSLAMYQADFDRTKMLIVLGYLDGLIVDAFAAFDWYGRHYALFQLMNLMRLLPYCKDAGTTAVVTAHLDRLLAQKSPCPISRMENTSAQAQP